MTCSSSKVSCGPSRGCPFGKDCFLVLGMAQCAPVIVPLPENARSKSLDARDRAGDTLETLLGFALVVTAAGWVAALALWLWGSI